MISHQISTYSGNITAIYQALEALGVDAGEVFSKAGVDIQKTVENEERTSIYGLNRLAKLAVKSTNCPTFGLKIAHYIQPTSYNAVGLALIFSENLGDFFKRLVHYYGFFTTTDIVSYESEGSLVALSNKYIFREVEDCVIRLQSDAWAAIMLKLIRFIKGPDFKPVKVELHGVVDDHYLDQYQQYFGCPVSFNHPLNRIYFDSNELNTFVKTSNKELARLHDTIAIGVLTKLQIADLPAQIYAKIIELLPTGNCNKEIIANSLNMGVRTMQNRLADLGLNYKTILNDTRKSLAEDYLQQINLTVSEVSYLLGYSSDSNFARAFQTWFKMSPKRFQQKHKQS